MVRSHVPVRVGRCSDEDTVAAALADVVALEVLAGRRNSRAGTALLKRRVGTAVAPVAGGVDEGPLLLTGERWLTRSGWRLGLGEIADRARFAERGGQADDRLDRRCGLSATDDRPALRIGARNRGPRLRCHEGPNGCGEEDESLWERAAPAHFSAPSFRGPAGGSEARASQSPAATGTPISLSLTAVFPRQPLETPQGRETCMLRCCWLTARPTVPGGIVDPRQSVSAVQASLRPGTS